MPAENDRMTKPFEGEFRVVTRHMVMEKDLNPASNLFGGTLLAWLDESTAIYVLERIGYDNFVTVGMDDVDFKAPGRRGDVITISCRIVRTGSSSVVAEARAIVEDAPRTERREIIHCSITYVCMKDGKTYPYFQSDAYQRWLERQPR